MRACSPHQTAIVPLLMLISPLWLSAEEEPHVIPFAEIGARATAQDKGRSLGITLVKEGALLRCGLQKLAGRVTPEGLWLVSTENAGGEDFCITANAYGREGRDVVLTPEGRVTASDKLVQLIRPGLIEEYSVSADGVRQDFVIPKRPQGGGPLRVSLEVRGACAEAAVTGARLILNGSGRQITYGKLRVTDAEGRECAARIEVPAETKLRIVVEDAEAVYPLRIDPTFSDADWVSMNPDMLGKNALQMVIDEMMSDSQGNLYVAGSFTHIGSVQAASIARWDGTRWWPLGSGVDPNAIYSMVMMGTDLIVSGSFSTIGGVEASGLARWNGSIWQPVGGLSGLMGTLAVSGSKLYVGGSGLTIAGDPSVHSLVSWNGSVWTPVGNGLTGAVYCLATHGGHLQVGGLFQIHGAGGGLLTENVAGWNGTNWTFYSSGIGTDPVVDLEWHQGELWAVANQQPSTSMIYKWSGTEWSNMHTYDRGSSSGVLLSNGADLFLPVKGPTSSSDSTVSVLRYDAGAQGWATLGSLLLHTPGAGAKSLVMYGGDLIAGGQFVRASVAGISSQWVANLARFDGTRWRALTKELDGPVNALLVDGDTIWVGGQFNSIGGIEAGRVARWDGSAWQSLEDGVDGNQVSALALSGGQLYVGGLFSHAGGIAASNVARWDGSTWAAMEAGLDDKVNALLFKDSMLYAGGRFLSSGGVSTPRVARWNGTAWANCGSLAEVLSLATVAGQVYAANGAPTTARVSRLAGATWTQVGGTFNKPVRALLEMNGGLYAGGDFTTIGSASIAGVAAWNGVAWQQVGGFTSGVSAMTHDGSRLFVATSLTGLGGYLVYQWDGVSWLALGSGLSFYDFGGPITFLKVSTLAVTSSGDLLLGGPFFSVGPGLYGSVWSPFLAKADLPGSTLSAQETWRQTHFGTYDNTGGAADTADFDDDGLANLIEYAFALDPTQGGSRELPQAQMTGGNVVVSFPQPAGVTGVTYGVEWSATMAAGSWQAVSDTGTAPQHTFTIPVGVNTQIFVRLKVTSP